MGDDRKPFRPAAGQAAIRLRNARQLLLAAATRRLDSCQTWQLPSPGG